MSRKGALMMLVAVVLWTAAPAFACLPLPHRASSHECCHPVVTDCCGGAMSVPMPCCAAQPSSPAVTPALLSAFEHLQHPALCALSASRALDSRSAVAERSSFEIPPLRPSPGGASILRL